MKQLLVTTVMNAIIAFILFLILQGVGTDMMDDFVERDLDAGAISAITGVNYILSFYTVGLVGACGLATVLVLKSTKAGWAFVLATVMAWSIMVVIAALGLYAVPGFSLSAGTFGIMLALFATFVLHNPGIYLAIFAMVLVASQLVINVIAGVQP